MTTSTRRSTPSRKTKSPPSTTTAPSSTTRKSKRRREEDDDNNNNNNNNEEEEEERRLLAADDGAANDAPPQAKRARLDRATALARAQAAMNGELRGPIAAMGSHAPLAVTSSSAAAATTSRTNTRRRETARKSASAIPVSTRSSTSPSPSPLALAATKKKPAVSARVAAAGASSATTPGRRRLSEPILPPVKEEEDGAAAAAAAAARAAHASEEEDDDDDDKVQQMIRPPPPMPTTRAAAARQQDSHSHSSNNNNNKKPLTPMRPSPPHLKQPFQSPKIDASSNRAASAYVGPGGPPPQPLTSTALPTLPTSMNERDSVLIAAAPTSMRSGDGWRLKQQPPQPAAAAAGGASGMVETFPVEPHADATTVTATTVWSSWNSEHERLFYQRLHDKPQRLRRERWQGIWQAIGIFTVVWVTSHYAGILLREWEAARERAELARGRLCFETFPSIDDEADRFVRIDECSEDAVKRLVPCPPHGICAGGVLQACDAPYYQVNDDQAPTMCVWSTTVNQTVADMTSLLHQWSVDHLCLPGGIPYMVDVATVALYQQPRPLFEYAQVMGTIEQPYDLELFNVVNQPTPLFLVENRDEHILIGLHPSQRLSVPATCRAKRWILGLIRASFRLVWSLISTIFIDWFTRPLWKMLKFLLDVWWSIFLEAPMATFATMAGGSLYLAWWQRRRQRRAQKEQVAQDIARAQAMVLDSLQQSTYEHRVDTIRDTVKAQLYERSNNGRISRKGTPADEKQLKLFEKVIWPKVKKSVEANEHIHVKEVRQGSQFFTSWQWIERRQ